MANTQRRKVITVTRSDGRGYTDDEVNHKRSSGSNMYTPPLGSSDKSYQAWLLKCSDFIAYECNLPGPDKYILSDFPDGYHLRAISYTSNDRMHYYCHGHPNGATQVFRSPNDFALHVIWLLSTSDDPKDCFCRLCNPKGDLPDVTLIDDAKDKEEKAADKDAPVNTPKEPSQDVPVSKPPTTSHQSPTPNPISTTQPPPAPAAPVKTPAVAAAPTAAATKPTPPPASSAVNSLCLYRPGEMIWFKTQQTWRLGIVKTTKVNEIQTPAGTTRSEPAYAIQPIAHALTRLSETEKTELETRPFLTFSVPDVQNPFLRDQLFHQVNWVEFVSAHAGSDVSAQQMIGLEASKMAAAQIDHTFSVFNRLHPQPLAASTTNCVFYGGMFLGPECFFVGEPVRLRVSMQPSNAVTEELIVLVVNQIFILNATPETFSLAGDLYRITESQMPMTQEQLAPLHSSMKHEVAFRNRITQLRNQVAAVDPSAKKYPYWQWSLIRRGFVAAEHAIKGRFYESHRILRIVDPVTYQNAMTSAQVSNLPENLDTQKFLNSRGDTVGPEGVQMNLGKVPNRFASIGGSISHDAQFTFGDNVHEEVGDAS